MTHLFGVIGGKTGHRGGASTTILDQPIAHRPHKIIAGVLPISMPTVISTGVVDG